MHRIDNNASCAFRVLGFAALSAVVVLAAASSPALAQEHEHHHHSTFAFVTASAASNLYMIDTTSNKAVAQIPKDGPLQTVTTPDGQTTYSVNTGDGVVLYVENNETGVDNDPDRIRVPGAPFGLAVSLDGTKLFVFSTDPNTKANTVSVIDTKENEVEEVDPAPPYHFGINVAPDGHLSAVN